MPIIKQKDYKTWKKFDRKRDLLNWLCWFLGTLIFSLCFGLISSNTIWFYVFDSHNEALDLLGRMFPPETNYFFTLIKPIWDTLNIATIGTTIGTLIAIPLAFLSANNTTPSKKFLRPLALFCIVSSRSINSVIWALLLVAVVGPGVLAGIIAIGLRSIGFCGKLLYEAIEEIDENQIEAIEATGANKAQIMTFGIVPQILPAFTSISIYRWDINIREATVVGLVGAGGIGIELDAQIGDLAWAKVSVILLAIVVAVVFSEWITAKIRRCII
jgi:phosphonate transport system permease protein